MKNIDYANYCHTMANSGNESMQLAAKGELEMLKGMLHDQSKLQATVAQMM